MLIAAWGTGGPQHRGGDDGVSRCCIGWVVMAWWVHYARREGVWLQCTRAVAVRGECDGDYRGGRTRGGQGCYTRLLVWDWNQTWVVWSHNVSRTVTDVAVGAAWGVNVPFVQGCYTRTRAMWVRGDAAVSIT